MDRQTPTLSDVARRAGVSYATADRVINNRGGVAEKSVRRVRAAIEDLGYVRNVAAANLAQKRTYRFAFVIPEGPNSFFRRLRNILETARPEMLVSRVALMVESVAAFDAAALVGCLERLAEDKVDGVALVGTDDARVCAAIDALRAQVRSEVVSLSKDAADMAAIISDWQKTGDDLTFAMKTRFFPSGVKIPGVKWT